MTYPSKDARDLYLALHNTQSDGPWKYCDVIDDALRSCRRSALDEAAKKVEELFSNSTAHQCANAIRALKTQVETA